MSPCMPDDVTLVDECMQRTPTSNMHMNKDFHMSTFHKYESENSIISLLCMFTLLSEVCVLNLQCEI